jgi:hypothetical protein
MTSKILKEELRKILEQFEVENKIKPKIIEITWIPMGYLQKGCVNIINRIEIEYEDDNHYFTP